MIYINCLKYTDICGENITNTKTAFMSKVKENFNKKDIEE